MFNNNKLRQAILRYVGEVYIQHKPAVVYGKEAFVGYFERTGKRIPRQVLSHQPGDSREKLYSSTLLAGVVW
jgi:predicted SnoaL-like aldol condensation-catalyzing enzyme